MFWNNFYSLCMSNHTTPSAVVRSLGLSAGSVTAWKQKGIIPNGDTLNKIANHFGTTVDDLLKGTKKDTPLPERAATFMELYASLSDEDKALAEAMLKKLAGK